MSDRTMPNEAASQVGTLRASLLITIEDRDETQQHLVQGSLVRIGADPRCEVVLPVGPPVRLYLQLIGQGVYAVGFTSGPRPRTVSGWLPSERTIDIAPGYRLKVRSLADASAAEQEAFLRPPRFVVTSTLSPFGSVPLEPRRRITIISREFSLQNRTTSASRIDPECVLYWDDERFWVVSLFGPNGVFIDGQPVDVAALPPSSELLVGNFRLVTNAEGRLREGSSRAACDRLRREVSVSDDLDDDQDRWQGDGRMAKAGSSAGPARRHVQERVNRTGRFEQQRGERKRSSVVVQDPFDEQGELFQRLLDLQTRPLREQHRRRVAWAVTLGSSMVLAGGLALYEALDALDWVSRFWANI